MVTTKFFVSDWSNLRNHKYTIRKEKYGRHYRSEVQTLTAFDIETSNGYLKNGHVYAYDHSRNPEFYNDVKAVSCMWVWQLAVDDDANPDEIKVYLGRTWSELEAFLNEYIDCLKLAAGGADPAMQEPARSYFLKMQKDPHLVIRIYIHNLEFEFQFLRNVFDAHFVDEDGDVFARQMRRPMRVKMHYAGCDVYFCDTLVLTQKSLKQWGKDDKLEIQKLEEDPSYYLVLRTPLTPLTQEEIDYSVNDVATMICGLRRYKQRFTSLRNIPMTQTGIVRRKCREQIALQDAKWSTHCKEITDAMTFEGYKDLQQCFVGGWTHANAFYVGQTLRNLRMFDFRSSYPAVMVTRTYPMDKFRQITESEMRIIQKDPINDRKEHYYVDVTFTDIETKTQNTFWSGTREKCLELEGATLDNGKIFSAKLAHMKMTDLDFERFCEVYEYKTMTLHKIMSAKAGHLPKCFIQLILSYYGYKTSLKGDKTKESLYTESKQFINSIYGVCVTRIIMDIVDYMMGWEKRKATENDFITAIERTSDHFTTYQIGVWVTAWARHNLWDGILKLDTRTVYCDTDSIKGLFTAQDLEWFNDYNKEIWTLCEKVSNMYGLDIELFRPETGEGKKKEIGFFDDEGTAIEFRTLGAKRYVYTHEVFNKETGKTEIELVCTIAGISKEKAAEKIGCVDNFIDGLEWTPAESGKLIRHYIDEQPTVEWVDYLGTTYINNERYGINLEPSTFSMGLGETYSEFLAMLKDVEGLDDYYDTPEILR